MSCYEDKNLYIDDESSESPSISWANMAEEELGASYTKKSFTDKILTKSSNNLNNEELKITDIDKIILLQYDELTDIELLGYQTYIIGYLKKDIKNIFEEIDSKISIFMMKLEWLMNGSKYLSDKLKLPFYKHKDNEIKKDMIPRSSYKFCNHNYECEYNYNILKYNGCYAQHYVHNLVYADIKAIKEYINNKTENNNMIEEIKKSINTISFVINHMYEELKNVSAHGKCHVGRTSIKIKKNRHKIN